MLSQRLGSDSLASRRKQVWQRLWQRSSTRKRVVRYGLLSANVAILFIVGLFVLNNPLTNHAASESSLSIGTTDNIAANPLDQLSSADIAAHVAIMVNLPEANSVANQADSLNDQLSVAATDDQVIAKPQVINTTAKTRKDIVVYTVQVGDTVGSLANKFGISSETIRWSNNLSGNGLSVGRKLLISPVNNGIVYLVKKGDTVAALAGTYHTSPDAIVAFNDTEVGGLPVGQYVVIPNGSVVSPIATGFNWFGGGAIYSSNGYDFGWCTWYVANRRTQIGRPVPSNLGNAYSWYYRARAVGLPTGLTPAVGAVAVNTSGNHVSIVEVVNANGSFWVSEMNSRGQVSMSDPRPAGGWNRIDWKFYSSPGPLKFIY